MFGSSVLDIAIGAIFVFLLLSVFATVVNELVFSFLNMRGRELLQGVAILLDDTAKTGLVNKIYNNGQVFGLFEGTFDPTKKGKLPSYIPSKNFALALLESVADGPFSETLASPPGADVQAGIAQQGLVLTEAFKNNAAAAMNLSIQRAQAAEQSRGRCVLGTRLLRLRLAMTGREVGRYI